MTSTENGTYPYIYINGDVVPAEQATVSIACHSLQYGTSVFGGLRGHIRNGKARILRLTDHYRRLVNGARIWGWDFTLDEKTFQAALAALIAANKPDGNFYIRPLIYADDLQIAPRFDGLHFKLAIYMLPLGNYVDPNIGMRLMTSSWRKFPDAALSTKAKASGCYLNSCVATTDAKRCGYDDALMTDHNGHIVEASVANIILSYHGSIISPPIGTASLEGITLRTALSLLEDNGKTICRQPVDRSMVYSCDELILTGTAVQISFAQSIDQRLLPTSDAPGELCSFLREQFNMLIDGNHPRSKEWTTDFATS